MSFSRAAALAFIGVVFCSTPALAQPLAPDPQLATPTFTIEGSLVNRTGGRSLPEGIQVRVVSFTDTGTLGTSLAEVDAEGNYRLEDVPRTVGATYLVGAEYSGVSYVERFEPADQGTTTVPPLGVFESVAEDPGVRLERSAWIFSEIDPAQQTVGMLEVHSLMNPTDRTFLPRADGAGGPSGLLVFGLPMHAFGLTPHLGLTSQGIVQIDRGFASLEPIRPGRTEIAFSYRFPYADASYAFRRTLRYPVESLRVLAPTDGPSVSAEGFQVSAAAMGDRQFQELRRDALAPGEVVTVTLDRLPARSGIGAPVPPAAIGLAGAGAGVFAVFAAWWRGRRARAGRSHEDLLDDLVALEVGRTSGRISESDYAAARAQLLSGTGDPSDAYPEQRL